MSRRNICASVIAGIGLWAGMLAITYKTSVIHPFYMYQQGENLLEFLALFSIGSVAYGYLQHLVLKWPLGRSIGLAFFCAALLQLSITYYVLEPVMFGELVSHRLFYHYMTVVQQVFVLWTVITSAVLIARAMHSCFAGRSSRSLFFLPLAWIAVFPAGGLFRLVLVVAFLGCLAAHFLNGRGPALGEMWGRAQLQWHRYTSSDAVATGSIFLIAFIVRAVYAVRTATAEASQGFIWDDAVVYERGASDLSYEGYSLFLRAIYALTGHSFVAVRLVQSLLGALICVLVFRLAKLVLPRQAAILAAAISVLNGALLFTPALEARETLLTFLLLISVYYPLKHLPERTARWDIAAGALFGLLGLVKTIVTPVACVLAYMRLRSAQRRWLSAALIPTLALLILSTKALVNRPLNIPVGRSGTEYAAMAYFAGNHPFTHGEQWFNLTQEQYAQLRSMGFRVGEHAGEAGEVAQWKQRYPRIAYCDRTTFETNTLTLLRYNLSRPARLLALMAHNAVAFLLGPLHHHQVFDTVYLLNESVFSTLSRILWLAIAGVGWRSVWRVTPPGSQARNAVIYISLVITYFLVVYTLMIGSTIYSIPIIPFLVILQASGIYEIASLVRKGKRDNVLVPPVMLEPTSKKEEVYV